MPLPSTWSKNWGAAVLRKLEAHLNRGHVFEISLSCLPRLYKTLHRKKRKKEKKKEKEKKCKNIKRAANWTTWGSCSIPCWFVLLFFFFIFLSYFLNNKCTWSVKYVYTVFQKKKLKKSNEWGTRLFYKSCWLIFSLYS